MSMKPTEMDSLLLPYLQAVAEEEAGRQVEKLMTEHAVPLINHIVSRKLGFSPRWRLDDGADIRGEILLQLLHRLRTLRANPAAIPIADFRAYVVVTSYRGCAAYLRQRYPQRWRLMNRLQYLLTSQPQFGLWRNENEEWFAGLAGWDDEFSVRRWFGSERIQRVLNDSLPAQLHSIPDATLRRVSAVEQMTALLTWADSFIALDDLVTIFSHWWHVQDDTMSIDDTIESFGLSTNLETQVEQRMYLQKLWVEIKELPVRQRQALLLNLRNGSAQSALMLLPALQIAGVRQIAAALEMPAEALAEIWGQLPFDDMRVAAQINVTRRQVINLRVAARERLLRRMRDW